MRVAYHEHMAELADLLGGMAGLAGSAMERATQSLLTTDLALAERVITERFADHAVEIGRRVVFLVTGVLPPDPD